MTGGITMATTDTHSSNGKPAKHERKVLPDFLTHGRYRPTDIGQEDMGMADVPTSGAVPFPQPGEDDDDTSTG